MSQAFIPQGTSCICTMMESGSLPQKLLALRPNPATVTGDENLPLLNAVDKKLSAPFNCRNKTEFWGGLAVLCLAIAFAAAVVVTGGAALGVAAAACAVAETVATVATVAAAGSVVAMAVSPVLNPCDKCLKEWQGTHKGVNIEGAEAVIQDSILICNKGGIIQIILDPITALEAARQISKNNDAAAQWLMASEVPNGLFTVAFGAIGKFGGGPAGLAISAITAPIFYATGQNEAQDDRQEQMKKSLTGNTPPADPTLLEQAGKKADDIKNHDLPTVLLGTGADGVKLTTTTTQTTVNTLSATEIATRDGITAFSQTSAAQVTQTTAKSVLTTEGAQLTTQTVTATAASHTAGIVATGAADGAQSALTATSATVVQTGAKWGFTAFRDAAAGLGKGLTGAALNATVNLYFQNKINALDDADIFEGRKIIKSNADFMNDSKNAKKFGVIADNK